MAVYAIGDLQGCYDEFCRLLDTLHFDASRDTLWLAGDLVNRGPKSLQTLRLVRDLGDSVITVLGNHDLHLLACAEGLKETRDLSMQALLTAADAGELLAWLRQQPLLHHDAGLGYTLVHAGLPPQWDLPLAQACAHELQTVLRSDRYPEFLQHMYGDEPSLWSAGLSGWERLRFISNAFTRLRYCDDQGRMCLQEKGPPGSQRHGMHPWFEVATRKSAALRIIFGHWSTLALTNISAHNIFPLDTGCVWGLRLTAMRLDASAEARGDNYQWVECPGAATPEAEGPSE
ncbi:MAG: symmetrical bis(5'-nucleosyl)-tetraphosphatase [Gammaproteobacteria bacterium]